MRYLILLFMILSFGFGADFKKAINIVIDKKQNLMWQDNLESTEYLERYNSREKLIVKI